jgi:hypothetical protein
MLTRHTALSAIIAGVLCIASLCAAAMSPNTVPAPPADTFTAARAAHKAAPPAATFARAPAAPAAPAKPQWTFPAPLKGNPPAEIWLPHAMSDEEKQHRVEADRLLMVSNRIDDNEIENAGILQDELREAQYDDMQTQLDSLLGKFLADPTYEFALYGMAEFAEQGHAHGNVSDTALLDAWLKARPNSAWAHYSRALRWFDDAWEARGNGWAKDVSDTQWKLMQEDEIKARAEVDMALKIEPRLVPTWTLLMYIDRDSEGLDKVTADFNRASKAAPTSYGIPGAYEETLQPRWLGSAAMMDDFAQSELSNLDKNPRFWELQGEAAADSGCAACNDFHWDVSLKQYNAALVYADRPSWLEKAGQAALHVHRYALAYAYYQRAIGFEHTLPFDSMFRDFAVERCDPSRSAEDVEKYRKDVVMYGGMDDEPYPLGPDACVVYQRELPWGSEPLPDTAGRQVYAIDSLGHPVYTKQPPGAYMPSQAKPLVSSDGKWQVTVVQGEDKVTHVKLRAQKTGQETEIFSATGGVMAGFDSSGTRLFVSNLVQGQGDGCRYYDPRTKQAADLQPKILQWAMDHHIIVIADSALVSCTQFINDDILAAALYGDTTDGKKVFRMFSFDPVSGKVATTMHY